MAAPLLLNPQVLASGIGAIGSLGSSLLGGLMNRDNMAKQVQASKDLMDYEWEKYKSPSAQVNALASAGINPAVALGQGGSGFTATPSPTMPTAPRFESPSIGDIGSFVQALAMAKKAGLESVGQELENEFNKSTLADRVRSIGLQNHWTEEQTARTTQEIGLMSGQFNEIQQKIENMRSEKEFTDKQVKWFDRHMRADINHLQASADYQNALKGLTDSQKELLDRTMDDLCDITSYQADQMSKIVDLLDKYGDAQAIIGMLSQVVGSASDLIGSITSLKNVGKVTETITGSTTQKSNGDWVTTNTRTTRK